MLLYRNLEKQGGQIVPNSSLEKQAIIDMKSESGRE
jgi:hypothetical protein